MKKQYLIIALLLLLSGTALAASCQTVGSFAATCTGGIITQDTTAGCRTIVCTQGGSRMQALACDKPNSQSAQYFELYKQSSTGTGISKICLGATCVGNNGFARSATYTCSAPAPSTPQPTPTPATTCTSIAAPVTCTGSITKDVTSGACRSVVCAASTGSITVLACDKGSAMEMYKQASTGATPKLCIGTTCIQNDGFAKSATCQASSPSPTPVPATPPQGTTYPLKTNAVSTIFWVGQGPSADTGWSNNYDSAWDVWWQEHYGGYDDPNNRNGYYPAGFTPKENPFYVAIPYTDFGTAGRKANAMSVVPWSAEKTWGFQESMIKNRWVRIIKGTKVAYAQVENAGPGPTDDWQYVFGNNAQPTTDFGWKAGIDVSPAVRDYLGLGPVDSVSWQWVSASDVPSGPWKQIVTTRQSCWASTICP